MKKMFGIIVFFVFILLSASAMAGLWLVAEKNGNVRSGPGIEYPVVDNIKCGDVIEVKGIEYYNKNGIATWFPIEVKADETKETTIGWFFPTDLNTNRKKAVGEQIWFFEEGTEDGKQGYLVEILPERKRMPGMGTYKKGKFSTTRVKTKYTKWVHSSLVKVVGSSSEAYSYVNSQKMEANRKAQINNLNVSDELKRIIKERKIRIGMTEKQVILSWGYPDDKNSSEGSYGRHEQWIYRIGDFKTDYLYFENGILTSYQLAGR